MSIVRTEKEIKQRIEHLKTLQDGYGINTKRIFELEWVLGLRATRTPKTKKIK